MCVYPHHFAQTLQVFIYAMNIYQIFLLLTFEVLYVYIKGLRTFRSAVQIFILALYSTFILFNRNDVIHILFSEIR